MGVFICSAISQEFVKMKVRSTTFDFKIFKTQILRETSIKNSHITRKDVLLSWESRTLRYIYSSLEKTACKMWHQFAMLGDRKHKIISNHKPWEILYISFNVWKGNRLIKNTYEWCKLCFLCILFLKSVP